MKKNKITNQNKLSLTFYSIILLSIMMLTLAMFNPVIKIRSYQDDNKGGYVINDNTNELFLRTDDRGIHLFFSKKGKLSISNTSDTAYYYFDNHTLKLFDGEVFFDNSFKGKVEKDGYLILYGNLELSILDNKEVELVD